MFDRLCMPGDLMVAMIHIQDPVAAEGTEATASLAARLAVVEA